MSNVSLSLPPGAYLDGATVDWQLSDQVDYISFTENGVQPAISKYIAYDTLNPPNPFLAVTEDGRGRVVYDGGFPKFYNNQAPGGNEQTFGQFNGSFKFLHNAINYVANPAKVNTGNRKILLIGDKNTSSYGVKQSGPNDFAISFAIIAMVGNWDLTTKTLSDWGGTINPTLAELEQYAAVILMSSSSTTTKLISDAAITELMTYRLNGNGIIIITDHGPNVSSIDQVNVGEAFFTTANHLARQFGAYFTGTFNRTSVNVGFLRQTYGDHPLYDGMNDTDSVMAGASESAVVVSNFPQYTATELEPITLSAGETTIRAIAGLKDGSIETYQFVYYIATGQLIRMEDVQGNAITMVDTGLDNTLPLFNIELDVGGMGTIVGDIMRNDKRIGELRYTDQDGPSVIWYAAEQGKIPVNNGDQIIARITSPFNYQAQVQVQRFQPDLEADISLAANVRKLRQLDPTSNPQRVIGDIYNTITKELSHLALPTVPAAAPQLGTIRQYMRNDLRLADITAHAYSDVADLQNAFLTVVPVSQEDIFNTWDRFNGDSYFKPGDTYTGDAAAWYWNATLERFVQPNNSTRYTGFLSSELLFNYEHEATFTSTSTDDDFCSLVMAFYRDPVTGENHSLDFVATPAATGFNGALKYPPLYVARDQIVVLSTDTPGPRFRIIDSMVPAGKVGTRWSTNTMKVKVVRLGDIFRLYSGDWNSSDLILRFTLDLNDHPDLAIFKGPKQYGYGSLSQPNTSFTDINFVGGLIQDNLMDMGNNRLYRYIDQEWTIVPNVSLQDVFGAPRVVNAVSNGARYLLNVDGSITIL